MTSRTDRPFTRAAVLAFLAILVHSTWNIAAAADFHAILSRFRNAPRAQAHLDVSFDRRALDAGPVDVIFDVFAADGAFLTSFSVRANSEGFASSAAALPPNDNLFTIPGSAALIRARTPLGPFGGTATLHQRESGNRLILAIPPDSKSDGTHVHIGQNFTVHVGDVRGAASLLIGNVSGADAVVDVFIGTEGAAGNGKHTNPRLQPRNVWRVDLGSEDHNANLVLTSTEDVVVQLVADDGRLHALTIVPTAR